MDIIDEYLRRAAECRKLAQQTTIAAHRTAIEEMCAIWEQLAEERRKFLAQQASGQGSGNST